MLKNVSSCHLFAAGLLMEGTKHINGSQFYLNCTNLTQAQLTNMNLSRGSTAAFCVVIMTTMLVILCLSKAYSSIIQRLFLYLIVATIVRELCLVATLEHQTHYLNQNKVCTGLGFVTHWSSTTVVFCAVGVILYTILLVCVSMKCSSISNRLSSRTKLLIESFYVLLVIFLPLVIIVVPLVHGNYGLAVAWCWIRAIDEDCKDVGLYDQLVLGYGVYEVVGIVGIAAMIGITITYCRISSEFTHIKKLLLQSLVLTSFVLLYILVISTALAIRIYSDVTEWTQHYFMWVIHGLIIPLCHLIIPFGFLGSFYFGFFRNKCGRKRKYSQLRVTNATYPVSGRNTEPSSTFFHVPYTDAFTNINETV